MIAIEIREPGEPDVLVPVERPNLSPGPGDVLIKVRAAGVNRPDVMQRRGRYPPPPGASDIPGLEVAGTVEAVGDGVAVASRSAVSAAMPLSLGLGLAAAALVLEPATTAAAFGDESES